MKIIAIFIGEDSLGYEKGKIYILRVEVNSITREDGTGFCPYNSLEAFLENWKII